MKMPPKVTRERKNADKDLNTSGLTPCKWIIRKGVSKVSEPLKMDGGVSRMPVKSSESGFELFGSSIFAKIEQ